MRHPAKVAALGIAAAAFIALPAQATVVDWTLSGTFDDDTTFAGSFTFNSATDAISNWIVETYYANYSTFQSGTITNTAVDNSSGPSFGHIDPFSSVYFAITNIPMGTGGTITDLTGGESGNAFGFVVGHRVTAGTAVGVEQAGPIGLPEPATWALMVGGFGGAGAMLRRRRNAGAARTS